MRLGFRIILGIIGIIILVVGGALLFLTPVTIVTDYPGGPVEEYEGSPKLAAGASCTSNDQCVYVLNAYPKLKCISENCPPEENPQPMQGDPAYEWIEGYDPACVNAGNLNNQNAAGDELAMDTRAASCACQPIQTNGETSLSGQSICVVIENESLETE